jgi:pimeloyl-ACP methyl ester carboxylesterase
MFIHGSLCDYPYWEPQLRSLASSFHFIVPSLAHYYPVLPSSRKLPFAWNYHVEQLDVFLSNTAGRPVHLVGHSRGGCLAYQLALRSPEHVKSLTLIDPAGPLEGPCTLPTVTGLATTKLRQQAVALIESGYIDDGLRLFVDSVSQPGAWNKSPPALRKWLEKMPPHWDHNC